MKDTEKYQVKFLEMKTTMSEIKQTNKKTVDGSHSRVDVAEEKVSDCEYIEIKTIQIETEKNDCKT